MNRCGGIFRQIRARAARAGAPAETPAPIMEEHGFIDTLRLNDAQLQEALDQLDLTSSVDDEPRNANRRAGVDIRLPYRNPRVHLTIDHPGGGQSPFIVAGRNLTQRGLAFLHGNYLHTGTPGRVELPQTIGGTASIRCTVIWCRHVRNHIHECAVRFDRPIDLWKYIEGAEAAADLATRIDPTELEGTILILSDEELMRDMIVQMLAETKLQIHAFTDIDEAIASARTDPPDLVLYDANDDTKDHASIIRRFREAPIFCPLVMATGEPSQQRVQPARDAGAKGVLRKPFQQSQLLAVLMEWLNISRENADEGAGENEVAAQSEQFKSLVDRYWAHLEKLTEEISSGIAEDDFVRVRSCCLRMFETAGIFGVPALSRCAQKALTQLDSSYSIEESSIQLQRLLLFARRQGQTRGGATKEKGVVIEKSEEPAEPAAQAA